MALLGMLKILTSHQTGYSLRVEHQERSIIGKTSKVVMREIALLQCSTRGTRIGGREGPKCQCVGWFVSFRGHEASGQGWAPTYHPHPLLGLWGSLWTKTICCTTSWKKFETHRPGDTSLILYPYAVSLTDSRGSTLALCLLWIWNTSWRQGCWQLGPQPMAYRKVLES